MKTQPKSSLWYPDILAQTGDLPANFDGEVRSTPSGPSREGRAPADQALPDGRALRLTGAQASSHCRTSSRTSAPVGTMDEITHQELEPIHPGVVTCFAVVAKLGDEARGTELGDLIHRFMADHSGVEIQARSTPSSASFGIEGTKPARDRFTADPRWPRLQGALIDLYRAELIPVSSGRARLPKKIEDADQYVFGTA